MDRHAWSDGVVHAMSGGTPEHARISKLDVRRRRRGARAPRYEDGDEAVTNPTVIVAVLPDSTERYDRDGKLDAHRKLASFDEYVRVSQDERLVEFHRRDPAGAWYVAVSRAGASFTVHGARIAVDDLHG